MQREVSEVLKRKRSVLYELVGERNPSVNKVEWVDNVTAPTETGKILLLIIGDGIPEDVEKIVQNVQWRSGLHCNLALVEAAA